MPSQNQAMLNPKLLDEMSPASPPCWPSTPAGEVEKNLRAALAGLFAKLDLVTREEFDVQREVLARTREKLQALEARVAELEAARQPNPSGSKAERLHVARRPALARAGGPCRAGSHGRSPSRRRLASFTLVGLPDTEVKEARDRVRAAIQNCGFEFPAARITVNLAPADLPKESGRFDLPIALGILIASGQIRRRGLDRPRIRRRTGAFRRPARRARHAGHVRRDAGAKRRRRHRTRLRPAAGKRPEAALIDGMKHPAGEKPAAGLRPPCRPRSPARIRRPASADSAALSRPGRGQGPGAGQARAGSRRRRRPQPADERPARRRQVDAGAAPARPAAADEQRRGAGKRRRAFAGRNFRLEHWNQRPFRAPHHSASGAALVGGGGTPRPGEISLAHHGTLFLDELPEFQRGVLEALREPLETGHIHVARAARRAEFPARFQLVAAMNPCPCGWLGHASGKCRCTPDQVARYRGKLSGPLLDRIDLMLDVPAVSEAELAARGDGESSARCGPAWPRARASSSARANPMPLLTPDEIDAHCLRPDDGAALLKRAMQQLGSARGLIIASSRWRAPLPTWPADPRRHTSPKPCITGAASGPD
jgi:magnesium chelatase family protein